jgi:RsiW-degrading membrane proteinase PrsW (M82 family)
VKLDREWFLIPGLAALAIYLAKFIPQERVRIIVRAVASTTIVVLLPLAVIWFFMLRACTAAFHE